MYSSFKPSHANCPNSTPTISTCLYHFEFIVTKLLCRELGSREEKYFISSDYYMIVNLSH